VLFHGSFKTSVKNLSIGTLSTPVSCREAVPLKQEGETNVKGVDAEDSIEILMREEKVRPSLNIQRLQSSGSLKGEFIRATANSFLKGIIYQKL
jgi:hypothetical protein